MVEMSIAILAGGRSRRMGRNKALLSLGGQTIISRILGQCAQIAAVEIILIANDMDSYRHLNISIYSDIWPNKGSLGGLASAIAHSQSDWTLILACDMPFVQASFLQFLITLLESDLDAVVPLWQSQLQPFHAIYHKRCLSTFTEYIAKNALKITPILEQLRLRRVYASEYRMFDKNGLSFYNVNTPSELSEAETLLLSL